MQRDWPARIVFGIFMALLGAVPTYYEMDRANKASEVRKLNQDEQQKLAEFTALVNQIDHDISSKDYAAFHEDAHKFMAILVGGQYDRAIGIEIVSGNRNMELRLIVGTARSAISSYFTLCEGEMASHQEWFKSGCAAVSFSDIDSAIRAVKDDLQYRLIYKQVHQSLQ